jgi:hypothetical protein
MKGVTLRVAVGSADAPFSGIWRVFSNRNDVYLGASKSSLKLVKISLHQSGVWTFAATQQSGLRFQNSNRRAKRWTRPKSHSPGVTRGPSIVVPHTSLGCRRLVPDEDPKSVTWFPSPLAGQAAELTMYYVEQGVTFYLNSGDSVLGELELASGVGVALLARHVQPTAEFFATVEGLIRNNVVKYKDLSNHLGGSFLWLSESADDLRTPFIVDLPVPVAAE